MDMTEDEKKFLDEFQAEVSAGGAPAAPDTTAEQVQQPDPDEQPTQPATVEAPVDGVEVAPTAPVAETTTTAEVPSQEGTTPAVEGEAAPATTQTEAPNYEAIATEALAPLKAAGRTMEIQSVAELRQLASMGVDYTRKMQQMSKARGVVTMLEKEGIGEDKLALLIDVSKGNPQAIAKLLKDSNIDPLDLDTRGTAEYQAGNYQVSEQELRVRDTLSDIQSREGGQEVIDIVSGWDKASQQSVINDPQGLEALYQHRLNGHYDKVMALVQRMQDFNQIPAGTPIVQAYIHAYQQLEANGLLAGVPNGVHNAQTQPAQVREPVATKVAAPKPTVTNGAAASAASVSQPSRRPANTNVDLGNMNDDDFLKAMNHSR